MSLDSMSQLYMCRIREFWRQPARIFWVYGFPTILAICLGLAFESRPPEGVQVDLVRNATSAPIERALRAYDATASAKHAPRLILRVVSLKEAERRLRTGKTPLVVEPDGTRGVTYRYDLARPEAGVARARIDEVLQTAWGRNNPIETRDRTETPPGSRYIDFLIPGLIGLNAMGGGLWGIGFLLVNFRTAKLLKCLVATPMVKREFLLSILGARLTFLIPDLLVLLLLGTLFFKMPIRGSLFLLVFVDVVGALAFAGIGLLIACRANSTEAISGLMNLVMLPMWIFSGVFFSSERFPEPLQPFIQALPLTQLLNALRGVILEGAGWIAVAPALAILTAWAVVTFLLALRFFRWS